MFEVLINLMLMGLLLQSQIKDQGILSNFIEPTYQVSAVNAVELNDRVPYKIYSNGSVGVELQAKSVLVVDEATDKILYEKDARTVRPIASITKLMTALVFLDYNPGWSEPVTIVGSDYREGAINYLIAGEVVTTRSLFNAALITSANEAAVALARSTGLTPEEFVLQMNKKAKSLQMHSTTFVDVTGLSVDNQATASDIIALFKEASDQDDIVRTISSGTYNLSITNKNMVRRLYSTNWILGQNFGLDDSVYKVEAGKTGHLPEAGYCLVSQIVSHNGNRVLVVVLGSDTIESRFTDTKSLAYWVFNNYDWP